jgi:hypothetical protein
MANTPNSDAAIGAKLKRVNRNRFDPSGRHERGRDPPIPANLEKLRSEPNHFPLPLLQWCQTHSVMVVFSDGIPEPVGGADW